MAVTGIRVLHATRDNVISYCEELPMGYYGTVLKVVKSPIPELEEKGKPPTILKKWNKGQHYTQEQQIFSRGNISYFIHSVKSIVRTHDNFSLVERILLNNGGEIELIVTSGIMYACSRRYSGTGDTIVTRSISKRLTPGLKPEVALRNAETGIFNRLTKLEYEMRKRETYAGLAKYKSTA